jgi:hypothetical protein
MQVKVTGTRTRRERRLLNIFSLKSILLQIKKEHIESLEVARVLLSTQAREELDTLVQQS